MLSDDAKPGPDNGVITLANVLKAFHLASSLTTTCGSIIFSILIGATPGAFETDADKEVFAFKGGAHIVHLSTIMLNAVMLLNPDKATALGRAIPVLGGATFVLELASAITESATA